MRIRTFDDVEAFHHRVAHLIQTDPVIYSVMATNLARARRRSQEDALWFTIDDGPTVIAAAMWTPPYPVHLSFGEPELASALARHLLSQDMRPPGVAGVSPAVSSFARFWREEVGDTTETVMDQRLFTVDEVIESETVPGTPRRSRPSDLDLASGWGAAFQVEAMGTEPARKDDFTDRLADGALWLWEDEDRRVSMTFASKVSSGVSRISYVYTPPEHRRRGYAGALVAAVSRYILSAGSRPVLFTDLANPTSNHIYQELGYRPVADFSHVVFTASGASSD
ncbi:MAG: GNAT family N-acetyltransferase [Acidimicrobiia bacterium]|nr:GNAT family N-acetyltransferase [Acidimicrobiia bacterium]